MWGRNIARYTNAINNFHTLNSSVKVQRILQSLINSKRTVKRYCSTEKFYTKQQTFDDSRPMKISESCTFTYRTHTCGDLRSEHVGQNVVLCGWVQYARLSKFLLIRDSYGLTQCVVNNNIDINITDLSLETIVKITGKVVSRPKDMHNHKMSTGEIEVVINTLEILNEVSMLPFNLRNYQKPKEQLRLQYRYIDLRFPEMQKIMRQRSSVLHAMRRFLVEDHNFVEVETPTLFCRTPGGAREFVVPTHHYGLYYSLVQSPQQFKQMLMAGGIDRYFQIARCYRDEATRPDRQPEFTQLDIEVSFASLNGIVNLIELLLRKTFNQNITKIPFNRLTYKEALETYGTDKPNIKYDIKMKNVSDLFSQTADTGFSAFVLPYPSELGKLTAKYREQIMEVRKKYKVKVVLNENISKEIGQDISDKIKSLTGQGQNIILSLGDYESVCLCLGEIRELLASILKSKSLITVKENLEPFWIVDFPLFVKGENGLKTCHHPFTAPHPDDLHLIDSDPLKVRSLAYDLILNGHEIGGGSVRIHSAQLQEKILTMLNIDSGSLSHFMNALRSGCPPHAGIALGIDRLMAVLCNVESIRDVIAFPKSHDGTDPLSGAPNKISIEDQKYYHIRSMET